MAVPIEISWTARSTPLRPAAVLGRGAVATVLAHVLADRITRGADVDVYAGTGYLLAIGEEAELPWVDGASWLGRDGSLLVPTTLAPLPDAGLISQAIARRTGTVPGAGWVVLLPDRLLVGERSTGLPDAVRLREIAGSLPPP